MIRHVINKTEKTIMQNIASDKVKTVECLNKELEHLAKYHGTEKFMDETPFLPTGTRSYQLVMTEAHKKWLATLQESNPLIGKDYFGPAPEYSEDAEIEEQREMSADETNDITETYIDENGVERVKIKDEYDPNNSQDVYEDANGMSADERNIFDYAAIKQAVSGHLDWKVDDIMTEIEDVLTGLHSDEEDYHLPEGLREVVDRLHEAESLKLLK